MKISTKGRYALRLMLDLALNESREYISIKNIAARQEISEKYLEQIITLLNKAGYVQSTRGAQGGYRLARRPEEYTVGEILRLTEGNLAPVPCIDETREDCGRAMECATMEVWKKLYQAISDVVDHYTLEDLVVIHKQKGGFDYMI